MYAFLATVPVTLIEAIHFVVSGKIKDADVYITKSFGGADKIARRLRKTGIFKHVFLIEDILLTYPITVKKCVNTVLNGKKVVRDMKKRHYEYGYYNNSGWLVNSIFYTGLLKGNKNCKQNFIEHGYNTYLNEYGKKPWYLRLLINLAGFRCMDGPMLEALYLFEPELLRVEQDGAQKKLPKMDKNDKRFIHALNYTFGYSKEHDEFKDKRIIVMEQGPQKVEFDKEAFWDRVFEIIDTKDAIIKAHPRQKGSTLAGRGIAVCKEHTMPWEVEALNCEIENKVQLAIFSGSCLNLKICCGLEPTIILLYKLLPVDDSFLGRDVAAFAEEVGTLFEDRQKYFIPESFDELAEYCNRIGIGKSS